MTKQDLFVAGVSLVEDFCVANSLPVPDIFAIVPKDWFVSACAYYRAGYIKICIPKCAHIGASGPAWSYPGYIADRTPYGVMAHELGHHVDRLKSLRPGAYGGDFSEALRRLSQEPKLTSYCPNDWEWFAEMFRLFVTNPALLEAVRPKTFELISAAGFVPVEARHWTQVLASAPPRTLEMAHRKAASI